jgi:hypothetical protein
LATKIYENSSFFPGNQSQYVFKAGTSISLLPGFSVERGAELTAEIAPCDDPPNCGINYEPVPERRANISSWNEKGNNMKLFPNPSSEFVIIDLDKDKISSITVVNSLGQTLAVFEDVNTQRFEMSLSELPSGIYFMNTYSDKGSKFSSKLIVE